MNSIIVKTKNCFSKKPFEKQFKTLDEVQNYLNNITNINEGGCGISALAMYRWLKKNKQLIKETCFYYCYGTYSPSYSTNDKVLKTKKGTPEVYTHVYLYHNKKYIDSNNKLNFIDFDTYHKINDIKFIVKSINNILNWNDVFDRLLYVPKIAKKLNIDLSDVILVY